MLVLGSLLRDPQVASLVLAFNGSFAITNVILLATAGAMYCFTFLLHLDLRR